MRLAEKTVSKTIDPQSLEKAGFYRLLVNSIQDYAIFLIDSAGYVVTWNIGAQKLKGYKPEEIIGKHFSTFYTEENKKEDKPAKELEKCKKYGHVEDEDWRVKKDGSRFWANVIITALHDESGELIGFAKVTRDLTERKNNEDKLRRANEKLQRQHVELEELNKSKDEFISLASHQLRTPATGVKQFLGILLEGYAGKLSEQQYDYLQRAYDSNDRQIDLVNNLLRVAQVDAGKVVLSKNDTDINELLADVIDEQVDSFKDRKQTITFDAPADTIIAQVDEMRFRMVLENLIDNASKYTPAGGSIKVSAHAATNNGMTIAITDNGVGIDESSLPKLFNKFSRVQNTLSDSVGGSGLGLYWANKIVELHGGNITVSSKLGSGSTFTITLPGRKKNA